MDPELSGGGRRQGNPSVLRGEKTGTVPAVHIQFRGWGPRQVLALLRNRSRSEEVAEDEVTVIYPMIRNHISRAVGNYGIVTSYGAYSPHFELTETNELRRRGMFVSGRPVV